jgi:hypothetical protein
MKNEIKWENPPRTKHKKSHKGLKWLAVKQELMNNPGKWALIREGDRKVTPPTEFLGKDFQRNYRCIDGVYKVYVRYVGSN